MVARNLYRDIEPNEAGALPAYVLCPNCEHPAILRRLAPSRVFRCRQCNAKYIVRLLRDAAGRSNTESCNANSASATSNS